MTSNNRTPSPSGDYLTTVDDSERTRVLMLNWAEYLVHTASVDGALRALTYYENIGWISSEVLEKMTEYVSDMAEDDDVDDEDLKPDGEIIEQLKDTPFELHAGSLQYIANLAEADIEEEILELYATEDRISNRREKK